MGFRIVRSLYASTILTLLVLVARPAVAAAPAKVIDNGPDAARWVVAIVGDGYAAADAAAFDADAKRLFLSGLFAHDFYRDHAAAFNLYAIALTSKESGVGTPGKPKDTALKTIFNGDWNQCWIDESPQTDALLTAALSTVAKPPDTVVILQNESQFGGCRRGQRVYVTKAAGWDGVAHELGHAIGGLYDEYHPNGAGDFTGVLNRLNCSTVLKPSEVVWKDLIPAGTKLPTPSGTGTVGMFAGCNLKADRIYRPQEECRMVSNAPPFCAVCQRLMEDGIKRYSTSQPQWTAARGRSGTPPPVFRARPVQPSRTPAGQPAPQARGGTVPPSQPAAPERSVHVVARISTDGAVKILQATEVPGPPIINDRATSPVVYEVSEEGRPIVAEALPDDPFVAHGFAPPGEGGHRNIPISSAVVTLKVPRSTLDALMSGRFDIRLYRLDLSKIGDRLNMSLLSDLKGLGAATAFLTIDRQKFKTAMQLKMQEIK